MTMSKKAARVMIQMGPGGVGKTTVSTAFGLHLAQQGRDARAQIGRLGHGGFSEEAKGRFYARMAQHPGCCVAY